MKTQQEQEQPLSTQGADGAEDTAALFAQIAMDPETGSDGDKQEPTAQDDTILQPTDDAQTQRTADADDPWASAPEALKNQYQHLQNDHRANAGRVSALTKKSNALEQEVARLKAELAGGKRGPAEQPTAEQLSDMSMSEIEDEFPEIAAMVNAKVQGALSQINQQLTPVQQLIAERREQEQQAFYQTEIDMLTRAHPDWQQVNASPQFQQWIQTQTPATQALYGSELAGDNINLLNLYKSTAGRGASAQARPGRQTSLADHAELDRKGAGRAAGEIGADPVDLFNKITS